ncbi:MAG: tRNA (adenosine(37)-N6)-dimethylallyltransferase MiaA [Acidimicrobiales bacterium]
MTGRPPAVALVGPTASGKSSIALEVGRLAGRGRQPPGSGGGVELVSVDSMAVYRGMDIGTTKPSGRARAAIDYHLVDLVEPCEEFTVQQFQAAAEQAMSEIASRGNAVLLVGGTGLYLRAVVDRLSFPGRFPGVAARLERMIDSGGIEEDREVRDVLGGLHRHLSRIDPAAASRIDPANRRRLVRALEVTIGSGRPFSSYGPGLTRYPHTDIAMVGLSVEPARLDRRIAERFDALMEAGFLDEVKRLVALPGGLSRTARQALGYRELLEHVEQGVPLEEAVETAIRRTRVYARRQTAWFRRDPRIRWIDPDDDPVGRLADQLGLSQVRSSVDGHWVAT